MEEQNGNMLPLPPYVMLKNMQNFTFASLHHSFQKKTYESEIQEIYRSQNSIIKIK